MRVRTIRVKTWGRPSVIAAGSVNGNRRTGSSEHYVHTDKRPAKDAVYVVDGVEHRWDGKCHDECENVR